MSEKLRPCDWCGNLTADYRQGRVDATGYAESEIWCGCEEGESRKQGGADGAYCGQAHDGQVQR